MVILPSLELLGLIEAEFKASKNQSIYSFFGYGGRNFTKTFECHFLDFHELESWLVTFHPGMLFHVTDWYSEKTTKSKMLKLVSGTKNNENISEKGPKTRQSYSLGNTEHHTNSTESTRLLPDITAGMCPCIHIISLFALNSNHEIKLKRSRTLTSEIDGKGFLRVLRWLDLFSL